MLRSSSKRAISSTTTVTCLPRSAARLSARDDRRVGAGPVQRLLDGEHVGVVGRLLDHRHDRVERLVRVVQQQVAGCRASSKMWARSRRVEQRHGLLPGVAQARRSPAGRPMPSARGDRAARPRGRCPSSATLDLVGQRSEAVRRCACLDLETHDVVFAPLPQLLLERLDVRTPPPSSSSSSSASRERRKAADSSTAWPGNSESRSARGSTSSSETKRDALAAGDDAHEARQPRRHLHDGEPLRPTRLRPAPARAPGSG